MASEKSDPETTLNAAIYARVVATESQIGLFY
jgi:hypothetical protein